MGLLKVYLFVSSVYSPLTCRHERTASSKIHHTCDIGHVASLPVCLLLSLLTCNAHSGAALLLLLPPKMHVLHLLCLRLLMMMTLPTVAAGAAVC
jgi:hypothetical protein